MAIAGRDSADSSFLGPTVLRCFRTTCEYMYRYGNVHVCSPAWVGASWHSRLGHRDSRPRQQPSMTQVTAPMDVLTKEKTARRNAALALAHRIRSHHPDCPASGKPGYIPWTRHAGRCCSPASQAPLTSQASTECRGWCSCMALPLHTCKYGLDVHTWM